uniref:Uncharacterized protein n=1 Tax=Rhizophora mucronata TaxID=61149 RepID=A0A2P2L3I0_RHIMU
MHVNCCSKKKTRLMYVN